jgi:hypothetical protein
MTRRAILALVLVAFAGAGDLLACGDKFFAISRGTRFQHPSARQSARILIYANTASRFPTALANVPLDPAIHKAGYQPTTVTSEGDLNKALALGGWDLLIADVADARAISGRLRRETSPVVLPVVSNGSKADVKQAKAEFKCVLATPTKRQVFLDAVDEALALNSKITN